ncbi:unnamed protein product [Notodromas monacha]|nr:unnamed protein product [Notodromas monacha]CAG0915012.1 unnamed protein product [Notodromas monacha]
MISAEWLSAYTARTAPSFPCHPDDEDKSDHQRKNAYKWFREDFAVLMRAVKHALDASRSSESSIPLSGATTRTSLSEGQSRDDTSKLFATSTRMFDNDSPTCVVHSHPCLHHGHHVPSLSSSGFVAEVGKILRKPLPDLLPVIRAASCKVTRSNIGIGVFACAGGFRQLLLLAMVEKDPVILDAVFVALRQNLIRFACKLWDIPLFAAILRSKMAAYHSDDLLKSWKHLEVIMNRSAKYSVRNCDAYSTLHSALHSPRFLCEKDFAVSVLSSIRIFLKGALSSSEAQKLMMDPRIAYLLSNEQSMAVLMEVLQLVKMIVQTNEQIPVFQEKCKSPEFRGLIQSVTSLCLHADHRIWKAAYSIVSVLLSRVYFDLGVVDRDTIQVLVENIEGKKVTDEDFQFLVFPFVKLLEANVNGALFDQTAVCDALFGALTEAVLMPKFDAVSFINLNLILQCLILNKQYVATRNEVPLFLSRLSERWLFDCVEQFLTMRKATKVASEERRAAHSFNASSKIVRALEILRLYVGAPGVNFALPNVQRSLMFIAMVDKDQIGQPQVVIHNNAISLLKNSFEDHAGYRAVVENCLPSEYDLLLMDDAGSVITSFYKATSRFGSAELWKAVCGGSTQDLSRTSAVLKLSCDFRRLMFERGGLEVLLDLVFRGKKGSLKRTMRWIYGVHALHLFASRTCVIEFPHELPSSFPTLVKNQNAIDLWGILKKNPDVLRYFRTSVRKEIYPGFPVGESVPILSPPGEETELNTHIGYRSNAFYDLTAEALARKRLETVETPELFESFESSGDHQVDDEAQVAEKCNLEERSEVSSSSISEKPIQVQRPEVVHWLKPIQDILPGLKSEDISVKRESQTVLCEEDLQKQETRPHTEIEHHLIQNPGKRCWKSKDSREACAKQFKSANTSVICIPAKDEVASTNSSSPDISLQFPSGTMSVPRKRLCKVSEFFSAMFSHNFAEQTSSELDLSQACDLKDFLAFLEIAEHDDTPVLNSLDVEGLCGVRLCCDFFLRNDLVPKILERVWSTVLDNPKDYIKLLKLARSGNAWLGGAEMVNLGEMDVVKLLLSGEFRLVQRALIVAEVALDTELKDWFEETVKEMLVGEHLTDFAGDFEGCFLAEVGCGFVGRHLVAHLVEELGLEKVVVVDKVPPALAWFDDHHSRVFSSPQVEFRSANLMNPVSCEKAFGAESYDFVINLAGETRLGLAGQIYEDGIYKLSLNCAEAAAKASAKKYIELSSGMMFSSGDKPKKESESPSPWTLSAKMKAKVESALKDVQGLNYCVLRPGIIYGLSDYKSLTPRVVIGGLYKYLDEGMKVLYAAELPVNTVHVDDVCRAICHLCAAGISGEVYHLVDDNCSNQESINQVIHQLFGIKYEYLGAALSTFAKLDLDGVVEEVNEKHMIPWAEMCQKSGVENTPISPYVTSETLLNKPLSLDATKLKESGFELAHPKFLTEEIAKELLKKVRMATAMVLSSGGGLIANEAKEEVELLISKLHDDVKTEEEIRTKEQIILELGQQLKHMGKATELGELIKTTRPFLNLISKAKAAKLVRALVEMFLDMDAGTGFEVELCQECFEWAKEENRTFLRQSLAVRLMQLYEQNGMYSDALELGTPLLKELKKLDDKHLVVDVLLCESKIYHSLGNLPKARAALTSARTTANGIYTPPKVQAALDLQSGVLHAADERDFKTAYSYFYEAFEGYDSADERRRALTALKYMLLAKIMLKAHDDVPSIVSGKLALRYAGKEIEAMKRVAKAAHDRSLADFRVAVTENSDELEKDPVIHAHLDSLYDQMLEQNLLRIVEPYSRVEISYTASIIKLPIPTVEKKLSQMILDETFCGVLDQGAGVLMVFPETVKDKTYEAALETIESMGKVVDSLYHKAKKLS